MLVQLYETLDAPETFEFEVTDIRSVLNGIGLHKGPDMVQRILTERFKYIIVFKNPETEPVALTPQVVLSDLSDVSALFILRDVEGEFPLPFIFMALATATAGALGYVGTWALATVIFLVLNVAVSMALGAIMQALTPTPEMGKDPSASQSNQRRSSLFNGPVIVQDQGGSVPLIFGNPFCGGVLISSRIYVGKN